MTIAKDVFKNLEGCWTLERVIPGTGHFSGKANFIPDGQGRLFCKESGNLILENGNELLSGRNYIYGVEKDILRIFYNDPHRKNEIMHELHFDKEKISRHIHVCGDDRYDLTFILCHDNRIEMNYEVLGPRKNYRMETVLSRFAF